MSATTHQVLRSSRLELPQLMFALCPMLLLQPQFLAAQENDQSVKFAYAISENTSDSIDKAIEAALMSVAEKLRATGGKRGLQLIGATSTGNRQLLLGQGDEFCTVKYTGELRFTYKESKLTVSAPTKGVLFQTKQRLKLGGETFDEGVLFYHDGERWDTVSPMVAADQLKLLVSDALKLRRSKKTLDTIGNNIRIAANGCALLGAPARILQADFLRVARNRRASFGERRGSIIALAEIGDNEAKRELRKLQRKLRRSEPGLAQKAEEAVSKITERLEQ